MGIYDNQQRKSVLKYKEQNADGTRHMTDPIRVCCFLILNVLGSEEDKVRLVCVSSS